MAEEVGSYGLLGDTRTAALVSAHGSIDWMCVPRFDGDPVFGALIDPGNGGRWSIRVEEGRVTDRAYTHHATSIRTTWEGPHGVVAVHEGMIADASSRLLPRSLLVRHVACTAGVGLVELVYDPRLGLPGTPPERIRRRDSHVICTWGATGIALACDRDLPIRPGETCRFELRAGQSACFAAGVAIREPMVFVPAALALRYLDEDDRWWKGWTDRFSYEGPHEENIVRSLITLRQLTYAPSGSPVAAPTTSLPAPPGAGRNWDYRFSWPRDASIGVGAFLAFGSRDEPESFLEWFVNASRITRPRLDVLYDLDGRPVRVEREVDGVEGFARSRPVRVGNAAAQQHQLDVYGWVLHAAWQLHLAAGLTPPQWRSMRAFADLLASEWREPDNGIWEERGARQHYVHSKLMAWTGLDRACRLARHYPAGRRTRRWQAQRDLLGEEIRTRGFDHARGSYRRTFDRDGLDASVLILPSLGFEQDPSRVNGTIDAVREDLGAGGPLLYRYRDPGPEREGAFMPCSFWLVQALADAGRVAEAEEAFDELCALATPLGLYAEQIDPASRQPLGNFPQAFTHATFLSAAAALNEARGTSRASSRTGHARPGRRAASARRS